MKGGSKIINNKDTVSINNSSYHVHTVKSQLSNTFQSGINAESSDVEV